MSCLLHTSQEPNVEISLIKGKGERVLASFNSIC